MSDSKIPTSVGFVDLLGLMFIGLKLTGHIAWPWIWVLAPIWIAFLLGVFIGLLALAAKNSK